MDPILDARLQSIERKLDEATKILSGMRKAQRTASVMRWLYWAVIIGIGIASIYLIQPYIEQLGSAYGVLGNKEEGSTGTNYSEILNQLKEFQANQ